MTNPNDYASTYRYHFQVYLELSDPVTWLLLFYFKFLFLSFRPLRDYEIFYRFMFLLYHSRQLPIVKSPLLIKHWSSIHFFRMNVDPIILG